MKPPKSRWNLESAKKYHRKQLINSNIIVKYEFSEKTNKIDNTPGRLINRREWNNQYNKWKRDITKSTNILKIKMIW